MHSYLNTVQGYGIDDTREMNSLVPDTKGNPRMAILSNEDRDYLVGLFRERLVNDVTLHLYTQPVIVTADERDCEACEPTRELLEEVTALSDKLTLELHTVSPQQRITEIGLSEIPAIVLNGRNHGVMRFIGIPSGYEFGTLVEDLLDVSTDENHLQPKTIEALESLTDPVHIKVFVTPSCPYCPQSARLAHAMAAHSKFVTADVIEANEFPEIADRYHVYGVPKTVVNDTAEFEGAQPEEALVALISSAGATAVA